ncbi:unnamed protein product [Trichobilharzia regenti]|nr:unnamed protein product [Trichobilharzia regenti]
MFHLIWILSTIRVTDLYLRQTSLNLHIRMVLLPPIHPHFQPDLENKT